MPNIQGSHTIQILPRQREVSIQDNWEVDKYIVLGNGQVSPSSLSLSVSHSGFTNPLYEWRKYNPKNGKWESINKTSKTISIAPQEEWGNDGFKIGCLVKERDKNGDEGVFAYKPFTRRYLDSVSDDTSSGVDSNIWSKFVSGELSELNIVCSNPNGFTFPEDVGNRLTAGRVSILMHIGWGQNWHPSTWFTNNEIKNADMRVLIPKYVRVFTSDGIEIEGTSVQGNSTHYSYKAKPAWGNGEKGEANSATYEFLFISDGLRRKSYCIWLNRIETRGLEVQERAISDLKKDPDFLSKVSGAGVRANLWKNQEYKFYPNNGYSKDNTTCTRKDGGVYRIGKKAPLFGYYYSEYTNVLQAERTNKAWICSFRLLGSSRPEVVDLSKLSEKNGRYYIVCNKERKDSEVRGTFKFFSKNNMQFQDGDWVEFCDYKVELVDEGEPLEPTAYIPHPEDLKGERGLPAAPIRPNLLKDYMGKVVSVEKTNSNYFYRQLVEGKWIEDNKAYVASADFELVDGELPKEASLLFKLNGSPNMYSHTPLNGKSKGRVSIYIPAGVYNTDGIFGYAGRAGKTKGVAARYSNIKLEEVQDGEPKEASAYLPHTDDLKVPLSSVIQDLKEQGISNEVKELLKADNNFVLAAKGEKGDHGKDAVPIRPNLFEFASLDKNSRKNGGLRIDEVTAGKRLSAGTINIHGGRDLTRITTGVAVQLDLVIYRTARENGEFKRNLTLRTMRPPNNVIYSVRSKPYPEAPGTYHMELICPINKEQSQNPKELYIHGWLLDWGRGFMDCELRNVKVEYLYEGETQQCSAYTPKPSDMTPLPPRIIDGVWHTANQITHEYVSTGIKAKGEKGESVTLSDLHIVWDGTSLVVDGQKSPSLKGEPGVSPSALAVANEMNTASFREGLANAVVSDVTTDPSNLAKIRRGMVVETKYNEDRGKIIKRVEDVEKEVIPFAFVEVGTYSSDWRDYTDNEYVGGGHKPDPWGGGGIDGYMRTVHNYELYRSMQNLPPKYIEQSKKVLRTEEYKVGKKWHRDVSATIVYDAQEMQGIDKGSARCWEIFTSPHVNSLLRYGKNTRMANPNMQGQQQGSGTNAYWNVYLEKGANYRIFVSNDGNGKYKLYVIKNGAY